MLSANVGLKCPLSDPQLARVSLRKLERSPESELRGHSQRVCKLSRVTSESAGAQESSPSFAIDALRTIDVENRSCAQLLRERWR